MAAKQSFHIYSTELKTQHLIFQKFHSSFHMKTSINLISLFFSFFLDLTFMMIQIRKSKDLCMSKLC